MEQFSHDSGNQIIYKFYFIFPDNIDSSLRLPSLQIEKTLVILEQVDKGNARSYLKCKILFLGFPFL